VLAMMIANPLHANTVPVTNDDIATTSFTTTIALATTSTTSPSNTSKYQQSTASFKFFQDNKENINPYTMTAALRIREPVPGTLSAKRPALCDITPVEEKLKVNNKTFNVALKNMKKKTHMFGNEENAKTHEHKKSNKSKFGGSKRKTFGTKRRNVQLASCR
jgi:hypothetical protein